MNEAQILEEIRDRLAVLAPLVAEYAELLAADEALTRALGPLPVETVVPEHRRGKHVVKAHKRVTRPKRQTARLHVQTVSGPTVTEIADREIAYTTAQGTRG
jgi:hypothetical protein